MPESLLIVGAGVIGCEFASFYNELGTKITMVEMLPQMLPLEDLRLAKQFQSTYRKRGIQVLLKTKVESITEYADDHVTAKLSDGSEITAEKILVSVGRKPNTAGIGLETAGVEVDPRGYVVVNDFLETTAPGVYAIGDVNGGQMLAHVASYEAFVAVDNCLGRQRRGPRPALDTFLHVFHAGSGERGPERGAGGRRAVISRSPAATGSPRSARLWPWARRPATCNSSPTRRRTSCWAPA